jgi:hypothetical protein
VWRRGKRGFVNKRWLLLALVGIGIGALGGCASSGGENKTTETVPAQGAPEVPPSTATGVDNFGFDIYRGLSEEGPFDRITAEPLAGAGTTDEPQSYVYLDEDIDGSRDYYYYIESISLGGIRETFSPIIKAPAKRP